MSLDYVFLWILTILNSVAVLLVVRQLATLRTYKEVKGPRRGSLFSDWTLQTLDGRPRSSGEMPLEYTMLFASETCGPCHTVLGDLARSERVSGMLVLAADGEAPTLQQSAITPRGPIYDEFLSGADAAFRQRFKLPGTPFAVAIRSERVVASGPARTPEELRKVADAMRTRAEHPPARL